MPKKKANGAPEPVAPPPGVAGLPEYGDDLDEPEAMILEPGNWWRGTLGPVHDGTYAPFRVLRGSQWGPNDTDSGGSGAAFYVNGSASLRPLMKLPTGSKVAIQYLGEKHLKGRADSEAPLKVFRHWVLSVPERATPAPQSRVEPIEQQDLPF